MSYPTLTCKAYGLCIVPLMSYDRMNVFTCMYIPDLHQGGQFSKLAVRSLQCTGAAYLGQG